MKWNSSAEAFNAIALTI